MSSLVIALLTNSAIIIRWPHINKYIDEPLKFAFVHHTKPNELNINFNRHKVLQVFSKQAWLMKKNVSSLISTSLPVNVTRIHYDKIEPYFFELCSNPAHFATLRQYGLVSQSTIDNALVLLKNAENMYTDDEKLNRFPIIRIYMCHTLKLKLSNKVFFHTSLTA